MYIGNTKLSAYFNSWLHYSPTIDPQESKALSTRYGESDPLHRELGRPEGESIKSSTIYLDISNQSSPVNGYNIMMSGMIYNSSCFKSS